MSPILAYWYDLMGDDAEGKSGPQGRVVVRGSGLQGVGGAGARGGRVSSVTGPGQVSSMAPGRGPSAAEPARPSETSPRPASSEARSDTVASGGGARSLS